MTHGARCSKNIGKDACENVWLCAQISLGSHCGTKEIQMKEIVGHVDSDTNPT